MLTRKAVAFSLVSLVSSLAYAEVHRCTVDGKLVVQDSPCAPTRSAPTAPTSVSKDELRRQAEASRERNAKEREEIQKGFRSSQPTTGRLQPNASTEGSGVNLTQAQVCRAAVAAIMGRDPRIVTALREADGVTYLSYVRPDDNTVWSYKCRTQGRMVSWGNANGRWRDHPLDGTVSFERTNTSLVIRQHHSDSSVSTNSFAVGQL